MKATISKRQIKQKRKPLYGKKDIDIAMEFASKVNKELAGMVSAVVLFGSMFRKRLPSKKKTGDIDVLVILDDVSIKMTPTIIQTYRVIVKKLIGDVSQKKLHVQILNLSAWWSYVRSGDPVAVNVLRDGFALIDTGWFDPLQALLDAGKIRPSEEAVWTYMNMSEASLYRSEGHLVSATMDLYWSVIDSAHASLMSVGVIPQAPKYLGEALRKHLVSAGEMTEKLAMTMELFYKVSKDIIHKKVSVIDLTDFSKYKKLAREFVKVSRKIVKKHSNAIVRTVGEVLPAE